MRSRVLAGRQSVVHDIVYDWRILRSGCFWDGAPVGVSGGLDAAPDVPIGCSREVDWVCFVPDGEAAADMGESRQTAKMIISISRNLL